MRRQDINDLLAFLAVAREGSFTKAAAKLGVSQSALSHTMRALEERLGHSPTDSHDTQGVRHRRRRAAAPHAGSSVRGDRGELAALSELREKPAGTIRITAGEHAAAAVLAARTGEASSRLP